MAKTQNVERRKFEQLYRKLLRDKDGIFALGLGSD